MAVYSIPWWKDCNQNNRFWVLFWWLLTNLNHHKSTSPPFFRCWYVCHNSCGWCNILCVDCDFGISSIHKRCVVLLGSYVLGVYHPLQGKHYRGRGNRYMAKYIHNIIIKLQDRTYGLLCSKLAKQTFKAPRNSFPHFDMLRKIRSLGATD